MTRIGIAGASGAIGRLVHRHAEQNGIAVVELDRSHGVDLLSGEGLAEALRGVDAVVDVSQVAAPDAEAPVDPVVRAARHLASVCTDRRVGRLVMLSINGVQDPGLQKFPFYRARAEQETVVNESGLSPVIVRSAQWFEFALNPAAVTESEDRVSAQDWAIQPVAAAAVAGFLVEAALGHRGEGIVNVAGPERMRLPELTEKTLRARGDDRPVDAVEPVLPGLGDGTLYAPADAEVLGPDLRTWLGDGGASPEIAQNPGAS